MARKTLPAIEHRVSALLTARKKMVAYLFALSAHAKLISMAKGLRFNFLLLL